MILDSNPNILSLGALASAYHGSDNLNIDCAPRELGKEDRIRRFLYSVFEDPSKNGGGLPYVIDSDGHVIINVDGTEIVVNDKMIANVMGKHPRKSIINNKTFKPLRPFFGTCDPEMVCHLNETDRMEEMWGKGKLKSFLLQSYPSRDYINSYIIFYRKHEIRFIVSDGKIYDAAGKKYVEMTISEIFQRLDVHGDHLRNFITRLMAYLTSDEAPAYISDRLHHATAWESYRQYYTPKK